MKRPDEQASGSSQIEPRLSRWQVDNFRLQEQFFRLQAEFALLTRVIEEAKTSEDLSEFVFQILAKRRDLYFILESYVDDDTFVSKLYACCSMDEWVRLTDMIFEILKDEEMYLRHVVIRLSNNRNGVLPSEIIECDFLQKKVDYVSTTIQQIFDFKREMVECRGQYGVFVSDTMGTV